MSYPIKALNITLLENNTDPSKDPTFRIQDNKTGLCYLEDPSHTNIANSVLMYDCDKVSTISWGQYLPIRQSENYWTLIGGANASAPGTLCFFPSQSRVQETSGICGISCENTFSTADPLQQALSTRLEKIHTAHKSILWSLFFK
jgi:hypothetical protein